jgi:hypothetical protein
MMILPEEEEARDNSVNPAEGQKQVNAINRDHGINLLTKNN